MENRLTALEQEVAELKRRVTPLDGVDPNWLLRMVGSQPDPDFEEALRLGREARAAYRSADGVIPEE